MLEPSAAAAIVAHMNEDHEDAVLDYARRLGGVPDAASARLVEIDAHAMRLEAATPRGPESVRIAFDHPLRDAVDARQTLIALASADAPDEPVI